MNVTQNYEILGRSNEKENMNMRGFKWLTGIAMAAVAMVVLPMSAQAAGKDLYCLYNSANKEFLYTIDENEKNNLISTWEYKGVICTLPDFSATPVYRLYDPVSTQHLYTSDDAEIIKLVGDGWTKEGTAYYVDDAHTAPVYRMFNPATGEHQFSGSTSQITSLEAGGWVKEGVAYYALSVNENLEGANVTSSNVGSGVYLNGVEVRGDNYEAVFANDPDLRFLHRIEHPIGDPNSLYSDVYKADNASVYIDINSEEGKSYYCYSGSYYVLYGGDKIEYTADGEWLLPPRKGIFNMNWRGVELGSSEAEAIACLGQPNHTFVSTDYKGEYVTYKTDYYWDGDTLYEFRFKNGITLASVEVYFDCREGFSLWHTR